jgi:adenylate cyclase
MAFLSKLAKSFAVGCIMGIFVALLTNYFVPDLIDRLEYQTYDMRYWWQFSETLNPQRNKNIKDEPDYGIHIVNIDDRSLQKMGVYWHWDRSFHARLIESLAQNFPAALIFDVLFYDPEDHMYRERQDKLLKRSTVINPGIRLDDVTRKDIVSTIDYDAQFVQAARTAGFVNFGLRMSNSRDYPDYQMSQIKHRTTMEFHDSLHPSSTLIFSPEMRKAVLNLGNKKPVIDGIFPALAQSAKDIGYVNMIPDEDGKIRTVPVFFSFGENQPIYLPISVRVVASLFGTPNDEIRLVPQRYLDLGRPFKIFRDSAGALSFSYPNVGEKQVRAIIDNGAEILSLKPGDGKAVEVSSLLKIARDADNAVTVDMGFCSMPQEIVDAIVAAPMANSLTMKNGESLDLGSGTVLRRTSDAEWTLTSPYGDGEYAFGRTDLRTLSYLTGDDIASVEPGKTRLLFYPLRVAYNKQDALTSTIPVLRERTLTQLCATTWKTIEEIPARSRMEFGDNVRIPLNKDNKNIITFFGPRDRPFPWYSYYDIMENRIQGGLEGKIFVVGSTLPDLFDIKPVPHDNMFPAVEIHASLMNSFITSTFITRFEDWQNLLLLLSVAVFIGLVSLMLKPVHGAILTGVSVFVYFVVSLEVFQLMHLWIDVARPVLAIVITYTGAMAYRYITEEKDRKFLQSTFKAYLSPELIDIMYKNKQTPMLGGDEGIRTAYFTDIQGFSTFSEKLGSPTRLVELLNEYLTAMTDILISHFGTLDKYEGDAIIAFFGAPMAMPDHAQAACRTALAMQEQLGVLRAKWRSEGDKWPNIVHDMRMRIGVNTGPIVTGNMGSKMRMNYTMMGDSVNLAARLESAAKQYGVYTMISNFTYDIIKNEFEVRELDKIMVVGKSEPVVVYELLAEKGNLDAQITKVIDRYREALALYYARQWDAAMAILVETEAVEPYRALSTKNPSKELMKRCEERKKNPPGADWDGSSSLTSK